MVNSSRLLLTDDIDGNDLQVAAARDNVRQLNEDIAEGVKYADRIINLFRLPHPFDVFKYQIEFLDKVKYSDIKYIFLKVSSGLTCWHKLEGWLGIKKNIAGIVSGVHGSLLTRWRGYRLYVLCHLLSGDTFELVVDRGDRRTVKMYHNGDYIGLVTKHGHFWNKYKWTIKQKDGKVWGKARRHFLSHSSSPVYCDLTDGRTISIPIDNYIISEMDLSKIETIELAYCMAVGLAFHYYYFIDLGGSED